MSNLILGGVILAGALFVPAMLWGWFMGQFEQLEAVRAQRPTGQRGGDGQ